MDVDFWASRVQSSNSKHFSAHLSSEVNDDARTYFTCPFCYVDTELSMLSNHLQEEHCFDVKNAVCPVCALNLGKDVVGHFKVHHATSITTRRRSQKSGFRSFYAGRSSLGGLCTKDGSANLNGSAPDPLLSPFLVSIPYSDTKDDLSQDSCYTDDSLSIHETESSIPALNRSEEKEDSEELRQRVTFCQDLFYSTIF